MKTETLSPESTAPAPTPLRSVRRAPRLLAAAAALIVVAGGIGIAVNQSGDGEDRSGPPVALNLPGADVISSCLVFDVATLAAQPLAFGGVVAAMTDTSVTIEVDRWYVGGDAATVELAVPAGTSAALDGVDFVVGERFLISAFDTAVNFCGLSGPATPELEALFAEAFPS